MTNNKKRRMLKEAQKETRAVEIEQMRQMQGTRRQEPRQRSGLSGAEKRRKRKGGNPNGGPGGGGVQGSMKRLKASLDKKDDSLRGHLVGKGFA